MVGTADQPRASCAGREVDVPAELGGKHDLVAEGPRALAQDTLDFERATAKLDTIKDDIVFWGSGAESQELIGSGEVTMSLIWNGRAYSAKNIDNNPVEIQWNGQIVTADGVVVAEAMPQVKNIPKVSDEKLWLPLTVRHPS